MADFQYSTALNDIVEGEIQLQYVSGSDGGTYVVDNYSTGGFSRHYSLHFANPAGIDTAFIAGIDVNTVVTFTLPLGTWTLKVTEGNNDNSFEVTGATSGGSSQAIPNGTAVTVSYDGEPAPTNGGSDPTVQDTSSKLAIGQAYRCYKWEGEAALPVPDTADVGILTIIGREELPEPPLNSTVSLDAGPGTSYSLSTSSVRLSRTVIRGICQGLDFDVDEGGFNFVVDGQGYRVIGAQQLEAMRYRIAMERLTKV